MHVKNCLPFCVCVCSLHPLKREENSLGKAETWKLEIKTRKWLKYRLGMGLVLHSRSCAGPEVGLSDSFKSLPNQLILWFWDYLKKNSSFLSSICLVPKKNSSPKYLLWSLNWWFLVKINRRKNHTVEGKNIEDKSKITAMASYPCKLAIWTTQSAFLPEKLLIFNIFIVYSMWGNRVLSQVCKTGPLHLIASRLWWGQGMSQGGSKL